MHSPNTRAMYKRLLALGLLSAALLVFGSSAGLRVVKAAGCIQDCEAQEAACYDACAVDCSNNGDAACSSCMTGCADEFRRCMRFAVWCDSGGISYTPNCQVDFTPHCPIINGTANCTHSTAHYGYTLTCNTLGGGQCVACPDHNWQCTGSGGQGSCY